MGDKAIKGTSINAPYIPEYAPKDPRLNHRVEPLSGGADEDKEVRRVVEKRMDQLDASREAGIGVSDSLATRPLTLEEAIVVEEKKDQLVDDIRTTRNRITAMQAAINEQLAGDGTTLGFDVDISNKARVRQALRKAFSIDKPTSITYPMYLAALKARRDLEQDQADKYTTGEWE